MSTFFRYDGSVNSAQGPALNGVDIYVCTQPANTTAIPPSPLATIYSDPAGANPITQPVQSDGLGNYNFYAATGVYTLVVFDPLNRIPITVFPDQEVVSPGGGSVTSVGLTMDGTIFNAVVPGSPVSSSGTLVPTLLNQNANTVLAGPSSGGAAKPTFRALASGDLPAGTGTVTSVGLSLTINNALISGSISGSPVTTTGTLALTLSLVNQNPNTFFAGPASGAAGAVSARRMVAADLLSPQVVSFSATPVFNASGNGSFRITLTGNVTSSSVTNATDGQEITFVITQDGVGSHTFAWPPDFRGVNAIAPDPNFTSVQKFYRDGSASLWRAVAPGITMPAT